MANISRGHGRAGVLGATLLLLLAPGPAQAFGGGGGLAGLAGLVRGVASIGGPITTLVGMLSGSPSTVAAGALVTNLQGGLGNLGGDIARLIALKNAGGAQQPLQGLPQTGPIPGSTPGVGATNFNGPTGTGQLTAPGATTTGAQPGAVQVPLSATGAGTNNGLQGLPGLGP